MLVDVTGAQKLPTFCSVATRRATHKGQPPDPLFWEFHYDVTEHLSAQELEALEPARNLCQPTAYGGDYGDARAGSDHGHVGHATGDHVTITAGARVQDPTMAEQVMPPVPGAPEPARPLQPTVLR